MMYVSSLERKVKLKEKQAIALKMLCRNLDVELISEVTRLTIAEIQTLQSKP
jgi:hypothetical protein